MQCKVTKELHLKEDDARVDYAQRQLLLYVEQPDGSYKGLQTGAFATKNYLSELLEKRSKTIASGIDKLKRGEISSIAYYMELFEMTVADLAARVALPVSKVRKQLVPSGFMRASMDDIRRYVDVFNIPASNLFEVIVPRNKDISLCAQKTANPLFTILEVS